jgi:hypothetical protein
MKINFKLSVIFISSFILFTIIGTLSHEFGHIIVAKFLGYETELSYGSMSYNHKGYNEDENAKLLIKLYEDNLIAISNNQEFPDKSRYEELSLIINEEYPTNKEHGFWITFGGPIQTILTGILGLLILGFRKAKGKYEFKFLNWLGVFLSLFVLREVFNLVMAFAKSILFSKSNFYGDEFRISRYLGFNEWMIPIITGLLGLIISLYIIFWVIPFQHRLTFIFSGFIGGILGYLFWFYWLGKLILP